MAIQAPVFARLVPLNTLVELEKSGESQVLEIENIERMKPNFSSAPGSEFIKFQ